jgi:hypothetical protein
MAVAALEAFINEAAKSIANWTDREDRKSIEDKWMIVPALLSGGTTFPRGAQPFQDFHKLINRRNDLVHAKTSYQDFLGENSLFLAYDGPTKIDVNRSEGRAACLTARKMIIDFSRIIRTEPPRWCAFAPMADPQNLSVWQDAIGGAGTRPDPDFR